jgi:hypothetical protein
MIMKTLKITGILLLTALLSAFVYANVRTLSPAEKLPPVALASFQLQGILNDEALSALEEAIGTTHGVTACTISAEGNVASVIFRPDAISEAALGTKLARSGKLTVTPVVFSSDGGCPLHKVTGPVASLISVLDLRN